MHILSGKSAKSKNVGNPESLEKALKRLLTDELCEDVVNLAYAEDGEFADDVFIDSDTFWDIHSMDDVQEICLKFFNGKDLDARGAANPNRDYFRFDKYDNVESTDYPGKIYPNEIDAEIVDYIIDHLDDREFPEEVQELINDYLNDNENNIKE